MQFARENKLFYLDECSALADINIKETFLGLINGVYDIQKKLIKEGIKSEE